MTYLISYDIRTPGRDRTSLLNAISSFTSPHRVLRSCWIVESELSAVDIHSILVQYIDRNDRLLVCQIADCAAINLIPVN